MDIGSPNPRSVQVSPTVVPTGQIPAGFSASDAQPGEKVLIRVCGFHTFDEGLLFYSMLEAFNKYVRHAGLSESCVDCILVCIGPQETHIYANNRLPMAIGMRPRRSIKAGESVFQDDIAAIDRVEFPGVQPPPDCGFLLLVSVGWRRGVCFDLRPIAPDHGVTSEEAFESIKRMCGAVLTHLHFTERFLLSNRDWGMVLRAGWFPFMLLPENLWHGLLTSIRNGWDLQRNEQQIHERWMTKCDERIASWKGNRHFKDHIDFLERAVRAYKEQDWLTVVSVAAPRVEGLMRMAFGAWGKQRQVIDRFAAKVKEQEHAKSLLFPDRLRQYFHKVFFRFTKFSKPDRPSTRHTLVHGLVSADKLTRKEALTLLLLIDHVRYCMPLEDEARPPPP